MPKSEWGFRMPLLNSVVEFNFTTQAPDFVPGFRVPCSNPHPDFGTQLRVRLKFGTINRKPEPGTRSLYPHRSETPRRNPGPEFGIETRIRKSTLGGIRCRVQVPNAGPNVNFRTRIPNSWREFWFRIRDVGSADSMWPRIRVPNPRSEYEPWMQGSEFEPPPPPLSPAPNV